MYPPYQSLSIPEADRILREYIDDGTEDGKKKINHSYAVLMTATHYGLWCVWAGIPCNLEFIASSALLHDIGRYKKTKIDMHMFVGKKELERLGYPYHARVAGVHGLAKEAAETYHIPGDYEPRIIEEKLVVLADFSVIGSRGVTVNQRFDCLSKTFSDRGLEKRLYHLEKSRPRVKKLEEELKALWKRNIYLDYIRKFKPRII